MTYLYEQLGDQRFQQLCQALVLETFPQAQCLPVGQADGGRDAFQTTKSEGRSKPTVVFQVKFHTKAVAERNPYKWLKGKLDEEKDAIARLKTKGLERYIFLTNVSGTSPLETGSVDKIQDILDEIVPIQAQCWWRDDLDRQIERSPTLQWHYPEILTGRDVLAAVMARLPSEEKDRRDSALRSYLAIPDR